jgi:hypothetical protein
MISMTEIDTSDTDGRLNRGISTTIAQLTFDISSSTEVYHLSISIGTNFCSVVDLTYYDSKDKVTALFITDDATYQYQQIIFTID